MHQSVPDPTQEKWYEFRRATMTDTERIMQIIAQAKAQMKRLGSHQWQEGYPATHDIVSDINRQTAYVLCLNQSVIAYASISLDGEPAYNDLNGDWLSDQQYVVVHRLAVADEMKNRGVATYFFHRIEQYALACNVHSFRVDTNFDNHYLLSLLQKTGFVECGEVVYDRGRGSRKAFEKLF